jgi:signal transduction histidine kinase
MSLQKKLIVLVASTAIIILLALSVLQIHWANTIVIDQAVNRVKQNINTVWQVLDDQQEKITIIAELLANSQEIGQFENKSILQKEEFLKNTKEQWNLDLLVVFDENGKNLSNIEEPASEFIIKHYVVALPLKEPFSGYANVPTKVLEQEQKKLKENCSIGGKIVDGLFIITIVPRINSAGKPNGIMLAGIRINNSTALLDKIQNDLFKDELYKGNRIGTVTIFSGPLRVATTVLLDNGKRAIGTLVSKEVENKVLNNGISWTGRAEVVGNWYLSRYEPIYDPLGKIIGMLYIGELEQIYIDQKYNSLSTGVGVISCIILFSFLISVLLIRHTRKLELEKKKVRFEFIRVLGHELKSPINAIESYLQLMDQGISGKIPEAYDKMINRSLIRIEYMRKLITDLLDLTRFESGQKTRELKTVDIYEVARESIEAITLSAEERNISIKLLTNQPIHIIADRNEIEIIFNNLISNAVKYNRDNGHVDVEIKTINEKIQISVKDTGIGMTDEEVNKLFSEFVRIKNTKTINILGSGLGLSIVKKIAKLYSGETHVISEPDVGSTFTVILKAN